MKRLNLAVCRKRVIFKHQGEMVTHFLSCSIIWYSSFYATELMVRSNYVFFCVCMRWLWQQTTVQTVMKRCVSVLVRSCCCCIKRMLTGVTSDFRTERRDTCLQPASLRYSCTQDTFNAQIIHYMAYSTPVCASWAFNFKTMGVPLWKRSTLAYFLRAGMSGTQSDVGIVVTHVV